MTTKQTAGSITCPECGHKFKSPAAVALAHMAKGVPKTLTDEQRQRKREIVARNRAKIIRKPKGTPNLKGGEG